MPPGHWCWAEESAVRPRGVVLRRVHGASRVGERGSWWCGGNSHAAAFRAIANVDFSESAFGSRAWACTRAVAPSYGTALESRSLRGRGGRLNAGLPCLVTTAIRTRYRLMGLRRCRGLRRGLSPRTSRPARRSPPRGSRPTARVGRRGCRRRGPRRSARRRCGNRRATRRPARWSSRR